jgi:hypothetical protein
MTRTATEARSRATAEWITDHVRAERRYRPPPGEAHAARQLGGTRKELAGRFYQLLSGHANIGSFLHRIGTDRRRHVLAVRHRPETDPLPPRGPVPHPQGAAAGPVEEGREAVRLGGAQGPEVRLLFDDVRAAPAVLTFLRDTRVGRIVPQALRRRREGERGREVDREGEGDEGGPGPP